MEECFCGQEWMRRCIDCSVSFCSEHSGEYLKRKYCWPCAEEKAQFFNALIAEPWDTPPPKEQPKVKYALETWFAEGRRS